MKALSIRQPWAWMIVKGYKDVENRSWKTNFRGRVYVHASKRPTFNPLLAFKAFRRVYPNLILPINVYYGGIIGEVDIVDCVTEHTSPWFDGLYGFVLANPVMYEKPIPCKGQLGFFKVEPEMQTEYSPTFRDM